MDIGTIRVVSGAARGRRLTVPREEGVRPTLNRIREALFTILGEQVHDGSVMDLFSGSGALGIEAMSRGARHVVFVEENPRCIRCIHDNITRCGFHSGHQVMRGRLPEALRTLTKMAPPPVDIVLMDPPYGWAGNATLFQALHRCSLLRDHARIVCEHFHKDVFPAVPAEFRFEKQRKYGDTVLTFFDYLPGEPPP
jgi:16S rRNA (guanine(966)-N(2))-methyltransferase RsmD